MRYALAEPVSGSADSLRRVLTVERRTVMIPAMGHTDTFTLADLCDLAAVTPRTVRYYIAQGLLGPPSGAGPAARYDSGHLARLRLIRRLQREHYPLADIRRRLAALSDDEAIERSEELATPPADSALDYLRQALASRGVPSARTAAAPSAGQSAPQPQPPVAPPPGMPVESPAGTASVREAAGAPYGDLAAPREPFAAPSSSPAASPAAAPAAAPAQMPAPIPAPSPSRLLRRAFRPTVDQPFQDLGVPDPAAHARAAAPAPPAASPTFAGSADSPAPELEADIPASRSQWERLMLDPDIELHVRRPLSRAQSRAVDRLLEAARRILREESR